MKKEEFPTFLNEQPTIIFGRTGRELLIIVCGLVLSLRIWGDMSNLLPGFAGSFLGILLAIIIVIAFLVLALVKVGYRPPEEWIFAWFIFIASPKVYMYKPWEEDVEYQAEVADSTRQLIKQAASLDMDSFEGD
jgi:hypothetical protein